MNRGVKHTNTKGRQSIENNPNTCCRLCKNSLLVKFGNTVQSCTNLFKPSSREGSRGVIHNEILKKFRISVASSPGKSNVICNNCARKVRTLDSTYEILKKGIETESEETKRTTVAAISPETRSPFRKVRRLRSPASKKTLNFEREANKENLVTDALNIDDLHPDAESSDVKVVLAYPSGNVIVKKNFDSISKAIIRNISLKQWQYAISSIYSHQSLREELHFKLEREVKQEVTEYSRSDNILKNSEPDQLAVFSNRILCHEVDTCCPLFSTVLKSACNYDEDKIKEKCINAMALATSTLFRCKNATLSAVAYRMSTLLFHSGASFTDHVRLHHLGVCMSPQMSIVLQRKMVENSNFKVVLWKREIEANKSALLLLEEIRTKQIPQRQDDDMVCEMAIDIAMNTLSGYRWYTSTSYEKAASVLKDVQSTYMSATTITEDALNDAIMKLRGERLPHYKLVADNIDHNITARVQTKKDNNRSLHWTHQFAFKEKVISPVKESNQQPQKTVDDLQLIELLPDENVQQNLVWQWAVLVSRVITKYLSQFKSLSKYAIHHIPHNYSKEMVAKSEISYLDMEFFNPNIAAEMAQILKNYEEKYVPCFSFDQKKEVLSKVPVHGDQLFEERARNVQWAFRDGENQFDRLEGVTTEHADWHAKVTLYKTEFELFVKNESAAEIGTSRASMNRTGKTNAAKGVHNHYNEYKDFHAREIEAHICASFMHMCNMTEIDSHPDVTMPNDNATKQEKMQWLLDLCTKHVEKYVVGSDVTTVVSQTDELDRSTRQKYSCRMEGCPKSYVYHGRRVRHEVIDHNLKLQIFIEDERDEYGSFYCRCDCGLVFSTKAIRNRHESKEHQRPTNEQQESSTNEPKKEEDPNDYIYNYHQQKLAFGLLLMAFEDAVKEGDGQRLFQIYKFTLLIFKTHNHNKYAYVNLLYLVKICAIMPEFEAERLKWNRFINKHGGKGLNIPLDLHKEHQNKLLKVMWRALGPNLTEQSAQRIAGTLELMELIIKGIDDDASISQKSSYRKVKKKEEAVYQITQDLISINPFQFTRNREGHPSFPNFKANILSKLDYRDLHKWMKAKILEWDSAYNK